MWAKISAIVGVVKAIASIVKNIKEIYHDHKDRVLDDRISQRQKERAKIIKRMEQEDVTDEELIDLHRRLRELNKLR